MLSSLRALNALSALRALSALCRPLNFPWSILSSRNQRSSGPNRSRNLPSRQRLRQLLSSSCCGVMGSMECCRQESPESPDSASYPSGKAMNHGYDRNSTNADQSLMKHAKVGELEVCFADEAQDPVFVKLCRSCPHAFLRMFLPRWTRAVRRQQSLNGCSNVQMGTKVTTARSYRSLAAPSLV